MSLINHFRWWLYKSSFYFWKVYSFFVNIFKKLPANHFQSSFYFWKVGEINYFWLKLYLKNVCGATVKIHLSRPLTYLDHPAIWDLRKNSPISTTHLSRPLAEICLKIHLSRPPQLKLITIRVTQPFLHEGQRVEWGPKFLRKYIPKLEILKISASGSSFPKSLLK